MTDDTRDPRALARELGGDAVAALVDAVVREATGAISARSATGASDGALRAAARRLAEPMPAVPKWPEQAWMVFDDKGALHLLTMSKSTAERVRRAGGYTVLPARLVPLDGSAVVLDARDFREARERLGRCRYHYGEHPNFDRLLATLDAALAAAEPEARKEAGA